MILRLRNRHRVIFGILAATLPALFVLGILFRPAPPPIPDHDLSLQNSTAPFSQLLYEKKDLWPHFEITTRIFTEALPPAQLAVELHPVKALPLPEVLAYWHEGPVPNEARALDSAFLLGTLAGTQARRWLLPQSALHHDGYLVLFSPPHQTVIAQIHLPVGQILPKETKQ